jgi:hypothetical protein
MSAASAAQRVVFGPAARQASALSTAYGSSTTVRASAVRSCRSSFANPSPGRHDRERMAPSHASSSDLAPSRRSLALRTPALVEDPFRAQDARTRRLRGVLVECVSCLYARPRIAMTGLSSLAAPAIQVRRGDRVDGGCWNPGPHHACIGAKLVGEADDSCEISFGFPPAIPSPGARYACGPILLSSFNAGTI